MAEATENNPEPTGIKTSVLREKLDLESLESVLKGRAIATGERILREVESKKATERKAGQTQRTQTAVNTEEIKPQ